MIDSSNSFIISSFRQFFQTLVIEKAYALSHEYGTQHITSQKSASNSSPAHGSKEKKITPNPPTQNTDDFGSKYQTSLTKSISDRLENFLSEQLQEATIQGGIVLESYYKQAQYIMVALADEVFLNINWLEKEEWENNLLETKLFHTQQAGTKIFSLIDDILSSNDKLNREIAQILFWTLGVGFKGRYKNAEDTSALQSYKEALYKFITTSKPVPLEQMQRKICPDTLQKTGAETVFYLPSPRFYVLGILAVLGIYFILSIFIWNKETEILRENIAFINKFSNSKGT